MSLSHLLAQARPAVEQLSLDALASPFPHYVIFFSVSTGQERACTEQVCGDTLDEVWLTAGKSLQRWCEQETKEPCWLRVDAVSNIEALRWENLQKKLRATKRNYFRFGLSFNPTFEYALLEQEIAAHALLYVGTEGVATPNTKNLANYSRQRFGIELQWPENPEQLIWRFSTRSVFSDGQQTWPIESHGRHSGYRKLDAWHDELEPMIYSASDYLARQIKSSGLYHYGWFPCFDRAIPTYNTLRHASSTYSLLEGWEVTRNKQQFSAIERALHSLSETLIHTYQLPDDSEADFLHDTDDEIKLGGNAVSILAMVKYSELTGNLRYLAQMERLANGICFMQNRETGGFSHVLNTGSLSLKAEHRIIYYDGEAVFALMRLYGLTKNPRWLACVERAMDYFIAQKHWQAHDHWLSYCVNELTLYRPEERYYQFGLDNVRGHLDFVLNRVTTYPTLLELMMAAQRMIVRLQADRQHCHLLDDFNLEQFYLALEYRARYLTNGFFWPELAMFFKKPEKIVGSFYIRHHSYRVRIDDVEHYLSGYIAYRKYLHERPSENRLPAPSGKQQLVFLGGNFRYEGNGIEIATIRRCALFIRELDVKPMVIISSWNPALARTVAELQQTGRLPETIEAKTVYDWLPEMLERGELNPLPELSSGQRIKIRQDNAKKIKALRYADEHGHVSYEDFICSRSGLIMLRRSYRTDKGITSLDKIQLSFAGQIRDYATEGAFASAMLTHNLDKTTTWHFLVDKNLAWRDFVCSQPKNILHATMSAVIHSTHRLDNGHYKQAYGHLLQDEKLLDRLLVLTRQQHDELAQEIPGPQRLRTIPHHLDNQSTSRRPEKETSRRVLFMARYSPEKQHQLLFRAFSRVVEKLPDAELHTWGMGALKEDLSLWVKQQNLSHNIYIHGFSADLAEIHRQSACSVLCSHHEGFSLFALESFGYGTPLVSFDIKYGPRDLLKDSGAGLLVENNDEQALADALISLLTDPDKLKIMQENAFRHASRYSEQSVAQLWQAWWQDVRLLHQERHEEIPRKIFSE
ncbi:glycosyltransferase [Klebsiella sp. BIGb0407]|uniref:glycosyltransferase n=1 Tax=Klebsiella sp. BIGb0407 TaxID=2940603 RepID=UPI0021679630|nr:glycosyltransferase [Klebsiella sp. BIGb0407]MCS3434395.1 glycosyltransferase involved in cell wall biosynthesis [Klebsiella sp. BIGb0407]